MEDLQTLLLLRKFILNLKWNMGQPARDKRRQRRATMIKKAVLAGVWTKVSFSDGAALKALSDEYVNKINAYRNNPTDDTEKSAIDAGAAFKKAWKAIK